MTEYEKAMQAIQRMAEENRDLRRENEELHNAIDEARTILENLRVAYNLEINKWKIEAEYYRKRTIRAERGRIHG